MNRLAAVPLVFLAVLAATALAAGTDETYTGYMRRQEFEKAYKYISGFDDPESLLARSYHLLLGSGVPRDVCGAVALLERRLRLRGLPKNLETSTTMAALRVAYGGSWANIAALEGSATAAHLLGLYYLAISKNGIQQLHGKALLFEQLAYENLKRAVRFGDETANTQVTRLLREHPEFDELRVDYSVRPVLCPVRN